MRRPAGRIAVVLVAGGLLGGLSLVSSLGAQALPLTPLAVVMNPYISYAPIFIAIEEGDFARQSVEVKPVQLRESNQAWPVLILGQVDVHAGTYQTAFFQAILQGAKLRTVADKGHVGPGDRTYVLMVRKDLIDSGRFRTLRDLRGMRIGAGSRGGLIRIFMLQMLRNRAFLTEHDVEILPMENVLLADAFRAKAIDAHIGTPEPFVTRLETLGLAQVVLTFNDVLPQAQIAVITYGPNLLQRNPGLGQRFMNAYLRGVQRYNEGKTDRNVAIIQKYTADDAALLRKMSWPLMSTDGRVNVESMLQVQGWWVREGLLTRHLRPEEFVDMSFATRAYRLLQAGR